MHLEIPRQGLALPGVSVELLVASATGSAAGGRLFLRLAGRAAGGAASGGLFLRLVGSAASSGFVGRAASRTGPARQIRECHNDYLQVCLSNFSVRKFIIA